MAFVDSFLLSWFFFLFIFFADAFLKIFVSFLQKTTFEKICHFYGFFLQDEKCITFLKN
jgi:hypothetical protein